MKKRADIKRILLIGIPMLFLAIGIKMLDNEARILWFERNGTDYTRAQFYLFSGEKERAFSVEEDDEVLIEWKPEITQGRLLITVEVPRGSRSGPLAAEQPEVITFTAQDKGKVKLHIRGEEARGNFEVRWSTQQGELQQ